MYQRPKCPYSYFCKRWSLNLGCFFPVSILNLVFDLEYIVAAFSMFLCLLGEVVSYLFYSKRPTEVNWWIHPNHISPQRTSRKKRARKKTQAQVFFANFEEFLRTPFLKNISGGCFWRWTRQNQTTAHDIPTEQMLSLNDSLWIILATCQNGHVHWKF